MIEVEHVCKNYGPVEAVRDVSFSIGKGEIVGLLGPNGAGKTTIIKALTCYHYPSEGRITVGGFVVGEDSLGIKRQVGYLPENAPVYSELDVSEYLDFIAEARGLFGEEKDTRIREAVHECGLDGYLRVTIGTLSKGYRQRVGLAQAILHQPDILILDEPTTGLDPNQIIEIRNLIKKIGREKTVILSTHILQEVEAVCDRVLILNEGKIVAEGTTEEIERSLKGETLYSVRLKGDISEDTPRKLEKLGRVRKVMDFRKTGDGAVLECAMDSGDDSGEMLFDWAVGEGYKILSMHPVRMSLEDIFIRLTKEGGKDVA